jgi:hypothetical protein
MYRVAVGQARIDNFSTGAQIRRHQGEDADAVLYVGHR